MTLLRSRGALAASTALALALSACSGGSESSSGSSSGSAAGSSAASSSPAEETATGSSSGEPFGAACAQVPTEGEGSVEGMSDDPVATAASNNPLLSTLAQAVTAANLVDSLNTQEAITVLAPADPAFEAVPADALQALLADTARLTSVLTHHVIEGRLAPDELAGEHTTLNGDTVTIEGSGEQFTVAAEGTVLGTSPATVVCGNVQTANATVYVIDQVLTPPAG